MLAPALTASAEIETESAAVVPGLHDTARTSLSL